MTGVDLCEEFIAEGRQSGSNVEWIQGDMRSVGSLGPFDAAFCFGNSFGYMQQDETIDFLKAVYQSLKPGAKFVLETGLAAESLLPSLPPKRWYRLGDLFQLTDLEYDRNGSIFDLHDCGIQAALFCVWIPCSRSLRLHEP